MLRSHVNAVEASLLAISQIPANSGHSLHKGTPREAFIREFLEKHLSERVAIGTGEIIDCDARPGEKRHQIDIVVYKRDYPKLHIGGGIHAFLAESVVATISVKSTLSKDEFRDDMYAAQAIKRLRRNIVTSHHAGYMPPSILSYVVAYDGPVAMHTVYGWLSELEKEIPYPVLPRNTNERAQIVAPALDAVFVLGKGFVHYGNAPVGFFDEGSLRQNAYSRWAIGDTERGSLLLLFTFLTMAVSGMAAAWLNPLPYLADFKIEPGKFRLEGRMATGECMCNSGMPFVA